MMNGDYIQKIADKLDRLNAESKRVDSYKNPIRNDSIDIIGGIGSSGLNYLKNKKEQNITPDPLFPDRNY